MTFSRQGIKDDIVEPVFTKIKIKYKKRKSNIYKLGKLIIICLLSEATYAP